MIERQTIVTWYAPEEKLLPIGQFVIATISGKGDHIRYDHSLTIAEWYEDGWVLTDDTKIKEFTVHAWCDLEPYGGQGMILHTLAFIGLITVIIVISMILIALWDMWRR